MVRLLEIATELMLDVMKHVTSADKAYAFLRQQGYEVTRSLVREVWKEVGDKDRWATVLTTWGLEKTPHPRWATVVESEESSGYLQMLKYTLLDTRTGEREEHFVSRVFHKMVPFSDVIEDLTHTIEEYAIEEGKLLVNVEIGGAQLFKPKRR